MGWFRTKTVIAAAGAIVLPLLALAYLASLPTKGSVGAILLQVAVVLVGLALAVMFSKRLIDQMNTARVGRWLQSPEGREWLESLPEEERAEFSGRFESLR